MGLWSQNSQIVQETVRQPGSEETMKWERIPEPSMAVQGLAYSLLPTPPLQRLQPSASSLEPLFGPHSGCPPACLMFPS